MELRQIPIVDSLKTPLWYQLWQKRLAKTSQDRTTLNNDFAAIPSRRSTFEQNTPLTKTLDLNFESAASAIPPLRRGDDSTRHAPLAKAFLGGRCVSKLRITQTSHEIHAAALRATLCPAFPKTHRM